MKNQNNKRISLNEFLDKVDLTNPTLLSRCLIKYNKLVKEDLLSAEELLFADKAIKTFQQRLAHKTTIASLTFDSYKIINAPCPKEKFELSDTLKTIQTNFEELLTLKVPNPTQLENLLASLKSVNHTFISLNELLRSINIRALNFREKQFDENPKSPDDQTKKEIKDLLFEHIISFEATIPAENHPNYEWHTTIITNLLIVYTSKDNVLLDTNPFIHAIQDKNYSVLNNVDHANLEFSVFMEAAKILYKNSIMPELKNLLYSHAHFISKGNHPLLDTNDFMSILNINGFTIDIPTCTTTPSNSPYIQKANKKGCNIRFNETVQAKAIPQVIEGIEQNNDWYMEGSIKWPLRPDISEMEKPKSGYVISEYYSNEKRNGVVNNHVRSDKESWTNALKTANPQIVNEYKGAPQ